MTPETYGTKARHPAIRPAIQALENAYDLFEGILGVLALAGAPVSLASVSQALHHEIEGALAQEVAGDGREAAALRDRFVAQIRQVMGSGVWVEDGETPGGLETGGAEEPEEPAEPAGEGREPDGAG